MFSLPTITLLLLVGQIWGLPLITPVEDKEVKNNSLYNAETSNDVIDLSFYGDAIYGDPDEEITGKLVANYNPKTSLVKPEELGTYLEGDILIPKENLKNGSPYQSSRWPNGIVAYEISHTFSSDDRDAIKRAINEFHKRTCLRFVERTTETAYILFGNANTGCFSAIGRTGGRQYLNLQTPGCLYYIGTIIHEILHAVGFYHEQSREERDNYVRILYENIEPGMQYNFYKASKTNNFGMPYDYGSVMHYTKYAFSVNDQPTILPKKSGVILGRSDGFSPSDLVKVNRMYNCDKQVVKEANNLAPETIPAGLDLEEKPSAQN